MINLINQSYFLNFCPQLISRQLTLPRLLLNSTDAASTDLFQLKIAYFRSRLPTSIFYLSVNKKVRSYIHGDFSPSLTKHVTNLTNFTNSFLTNSNKKLKVKAKVNYMCVLISSNFAMKNSPIIRDKRNKKKLQVKSIREIQR